MSAQVVPLNPHRRALAHLVADHGDALPLDRATALLAAEEHPGLDPDAPVRALDDLASGVRSRADGTLFLQVAALNHRLFVEAGFAGDEEQYDHPDNSMLDSVLTRRRGLPILLSVVYMELARRLGVEIDGVGFPGHFVVSPRRASPRFFIDPFRAGKVLGEVDLRVILRRLAGTWDVEPSTWRRFTAPVTPGAVFLRINTNLKRCWSRRRRPEAALRACERALLVAPDHLPDLHDRAVLLAQLGHLPAAIESLDRALEGRASDPDLACLRALRDQLAAEPRSR